MATLTLKKQDGSDAGSFELAPAVFETEPNAVVVREVYNAYMANQRQGTHSTKTRGHVRGGGAKPWKQKGTGRARQGSIRATQWRGGAIAHGPLPRSYNQKINKKKKALAYRSLLASKLGSNEIIGLDAIKFDSPRTKDVTGMLNALNADTRKVLIVTQEKDDSLLRAAANLETVKVQVVNAISIFDLLVCDRLVITRDALQTLQERLS